MPFSIETLVQVARVDLEMHKAFSISIMHWQERKPVSNDITGDCAEAVSCQMVDNSTSKATLMLMLNLAGTTKSLLQVT